MRLVSVLPRSCGIHLLEEFQFYILHSDSTQIIASEVLLCNCSVQILPSHLITEEPHLTDQHQRILLQPESAHAWKVKKIPDALGLIPGIISLLFSMNFMPYDLFGPSCFCIWSYLCLIFSETLLLGLYSPVSLISQQGCLTL